MAAPSYPKVPSHYNLKAKKGGGKREKGNFGEKGRREGGGRGNFFAATFSQTKRLIEEGGKKGRGSSKRWRKKP